MTFAGAGVAGNSIANGIYDVTLNASGVAVPIGDSLAVGRTDTFYRLYGDINGDKRVSTFDLSGPGGFNSTYGLRSNQAGFVAALDLNNDGCISTFDLSGAGGFNADYGIRYG